MLISLLFHRVSKGSRAPFSSKIEDLQRLLQGIKKSYPLVLPGEKLSFKKRSFCLTFDDAFYDFYHYLFPFLKEEKIPVVLAVIPGLTPEKGELSSQKRLTIATQEAFDLKKRQAFCSWEELREMTSTPWVYPACHSFSHTNLKLAKDLKKEILGSKQMLEERLLIPIDTFVYPYGKFNAQVKREVKKHYPYQFRIGSSINFNWKNLTGLTYRIPMDQKIQISLKGNLVVRWICHSLRGR